MFEPGDRREYHRNRVEQMKRDGAWEDWERRDEIRYRVSLILGTPLLLVFLSQITLAVAAGVARTLSVDSTSLGTETKVLLSSALVAIALAISKAARKWPVPFYFVEASLG